MSSPENPEPLSIPPADLREQRALLCDCVEDAVFVVTLDGAIIDWSPSAVRLFGWSRAEALGQSPEIIHRPEEASKLVAEMRATALRTGRWRGEITFVRQGGVGGVCESTVIPLQRPGEPVFALICICHDISLQQQAEWKLFEERLLLRALIDAVPDLIFCKDKEARYLLRNSADQRIGGNKDDYIGLTVFDVPGMAPHAGQSYADDMRVITTGEPLINREEPFTSPSGMIGWFLTSKYPLRDAAGAVYGLVGIARDITDLKRTTEQLNLTQKRLLDHVEHSPLAVVEWRPDFSVAHWTGNAQTLFGWSAEEVTHKDFDAWTLVHPEDRPYVLDQASRLLDGREVRNFFQTRNMTREGSVFHCLWHNSVLRSADGMSFSILSLGQDITEREAAEETIRGHERLYHALVEATGTGYVHFDEAGRATEVNEEFLRLTGRTSVAELAGRPIAAWTVPHDQERAAAEFEKGIASGSVRNLELDYLTPDGRVVPVEINARVRPTATGRCMIAFCRDISLRRAAEAERRAFEHQLQETQKLESLGILAGGIAHDFNNLLTGVLGNASLALMDAGPDSPLQPFLEQIEIAATRAADLCRQMLAYSGKGSFTVSRLDLNAAVEETARLLQISISKKAEVHYSLFPGLPAISGDITQLRQVIMNLVINASEAVAESNGEIWVATSVVYVKSERLTLGQVSANLTEGDYVCLEVRDNGHGMTPEVRDRIFEPFFTTKFTGRGLGLAAVLGIIRGHKGALKVESKPGKGTTFRVLLPCIEGPVDLALNPAPTPGAWKGCGDVLIIDDEETVRVTTGHMLEALGFKVSAASDGREGVTMFAQCQASLALVLLDLTMPQVDGDEALREITRLNPNVPVLLMSGFDEFEVMARFKGQEVAGFIQKPFRLAALRQIIQQIFA